MVDDTHDLMSSSCLMPVFQMAPCLAATVNWCSFFFVYIDIKMNVICEIRMLPSPSEHLLSGEYYWHRAHGLLSHKYVIKSLTACFPSSQSIAVAKGNIWCAEISQHWLLQVLQESLPEQQHGWMKAAEYNKECHFLHLSVLSSKKLGYHLPSQMVW